MTIQILILFVLIFGMIVTIATEKISPDTLSVIIMVILIIGGFVTPAEGLAGFSNQANITILMLMILTVGLETTGVITAMGKRLKSLLIGKEWKTLTCLMLIAGLGSAFISTTAIVIVFMRVLLKLSNELPTNLSRLLMPLSFAGILGGSCTLLGTSTNLLVSSMAKDAGLQPFNVFEFTYLGAILFVAGVLYMLILGKKLLPSKSKEQNLYDEYNVQKYLTNLVITEGSDLIGKRIKETEFFDHGEVDLIRIKRGDELVFPDELRKFRVNDILLLKCNVEKLASIREAENLKLVPYKSAVSEEQMGDQDMTLCEVFIKSNSKLVGKYIDKIEIKRLYDAIPLAIKKSATYYTEDFESLKIDTGDILLMEISRTNFRNFYNRSDIIVLQEHEELAAKSKKRYLAAGIVFGVVLLSACNIVPILQSALLGCVCMVLSGCLDLQKAYRRIDWSVFFLLAGIIPLGTAMQNTGASQLIADTCLYLFESVSPRVLVSALCCATMLLSAIISNNATAILLVPIALSISVNLNIDPRPLLITIMLAANMSFLSPIGYQTNTLVYTVGKYHFTDFVKVGGLLSLLIWVLISLLVPYFYF